MTAVVHGIPNCDTVKKARTWLDEHQVAYAFHDFKKQGVPPGDLDTWLEVLGWERVLNRKGTTWRKLPADVQAAVTDAASARVLVLQQPSVVKRPVVRWPDGRLTIGFDPQEFAAHAG